MLLDAIGAPYHRPLVSMLELIWFMHVITMCWLFVKGL